MKKQFKDDCIKDCVYDQSNLLHLRVKAGTETAKRCEDWCKSGIKDKKLRDAGCEKTCLPNPIIIDLDEAVKLALRDPGNY